MCKCLKFYGLHVACPLPLSVCCKQNDGVTEVLGLMYSDDGHSFSGILVNVCQNSSQ